MIKPNIKKIKATFQLIHKNDYPLMDFDLEFGEHEYPKQPIQALTKNGKEFTFILTASYDMFMGWVKKIAETKPTIWRYRDVAENEFERIIRRDMNEIISRLFGLEYNLRINFTRPENL